MSEQLVVLGSGRVTSCRVLADDVPMMRAAEVRELDRQLQALLAEVDAGRIDATDVDRARLDGAVVALAVVLGRDVAGALTVGGPA